MKKRLLVMKFFKEPGAEISGPGVVPKFKKISILIFSEQGYTPRPAPTVYPN